MAGVVRDWRIELMGAHPRVFPVSPGSAHATQGFPECGEGWRDLLERACVRIEAALGPGDTFETVQIKEKYATLRWYYTGRLAQNAKVKVEEAIDLAAARSACTWETCGLEGRLYSRGGWLATACPEHARGEPVPIRPGFDNLHIIRKYGAGGLQVGSCRRYDRVTDAFVNVDPGALGTEEA